MSFLFRSTFGLASLVILSPHLRAETLSGKVIGPDNKPVVATVYYVFNGGWNATQKQVQTEPDGSFRFEVQPATVPKGMAVFPALQKARGGVAVYAPGLSLGTAFLEVDEPGTVKLLAPRGIRGSLRDDKGALVANATLRVSHFFQDFGSRQDRKSLFFDPPVPLRPQFTVKTDAKGSWEILGVPPLASAIIQLDDDRFVDASTQFNAEGEADGPGRQGLVARRAGSISGRVLDVKGKPAVGVQVIASPKPGQAKAREMGGFAQTGADGTFRMPRVTPGTYSLLIRDRRAGRPRFEGEGESPKWAAPVIAPAMEDVLVEAGQVAGDNTLQLVTPAIVTGRVVDAKSGLPLSEVSVGAFGKGAPRTAGMLPATLTDKEGRFQMALVPGANAIYAFEAERWGNNTPADPASAAVTLVAGANKAVSLRVGRRFADVQGEIVEENGTPASAVEITLWNTRGTGQYIRSDEKGHFDLKRMDIGTLRLDPPNEWTVISPKNITLPVAAPVKIVVRRNQMAKVTLRVVDGAGKPVEGVKMRFTMPIEHEGRGARAILSPVSDDKGEYVFEALKMPEALQLKLENATRKGYKWKEGGGAASAAKASDTAFALSYVVMESLGGILKGKVSSAAGLPAEGVLVRSSGDGYENLATSDAAGVFSLSDQPQGEVEVVAAQGRDFGRIKAQGGADATIVLQPGAPVPPRSVERALELFREMAPSADARTLSKAAIALAPYQPAKSLELLLLAPKARPDAARLQIIGTLTPNSSEEALAWAQKEVTQITGDADFVRAGARLGNLLAARQPAAANALFEAINARRAKLTGDAAIVGTAWTAALAARLQLAAAPRLFDQALAAGLRAPSELKSIVEPLSSGTTPLAEAILEELPPGSEGNIYLYRMAIQQVARYDVAGAQRLLEQMRVLVDAVPQRPTENGQYRGRDALEFDWAFAAKDVMRALPRTEVEAATEIARRVQGWHRTSALALAAEFGSKEQRLAMAGEAIAADTRGDWMKTVTLPRLGALAAELDGASATRWFEEGAELNENQRRDHNSNLSPDWSYYAAFWNPAPARLNLEAEWARLERQAEKPEDKEYGFRDYAQASLAMAMSSIDLDRALEWARQMSDKPSPGNASPRARALEFIGELLLQEPAKRRLLVIAGESGFDN